MEELLKIIFWLRVFLVQVRILARKLCVADLAILEEGIVLLALLRLRVFVQRGITYDFTFISHLPLRSLKGLKCGL